MSGIRYTLTSLVVLSLFIATPSGIPALSTNENQPDIPIYPAASQTVEWLTFRSEELGYEFSYPSDWHLSEGVSTGYPYVTLLDPVAQALPPGSLEVNQGAWIEISAERFTAVVPVEEYVRMNVKPAFGENGELLDVATEVNSSSIWGGAGYYFVHHRGSLVQHNHAGLAAYSGGSLLLQIMLTISDSTYEESYGETYHRIVESLVFTPLIDIPEQQESISVSSENGLLNSALITGAEVQAEAYNSTHYLTLPFYSHTDMKVQQGWVSSFDSNHRGVDYIKGQFDDSTTWQSFDVLAAADGVACVNCTTSRSGNTVWIKHTVNNKAFFTYYGHLESYDSSIPVGSQANPVTVKRGQKIGTAGYTGSVVGWTHLHFTSWVNFDGTLRLMDPYDINPDPAQSQSVTRISYFPNSTYTSMGPDHVFISDPPSYFGGSSIGVNQGGGTTIDLVEIIDSSGSMSWNDPNGQRRNAAKTFVDTSISGDFIGVVDFDWSARLASPLVRVPENRQSLFTAIDTIDSSGSTNLGAGLQAGCDALINSSSSNARKGAIFLTDGQGSYSGQASCYSSRGWPIFAFGLDDADDTLLSNIAASTGGEYKRLPTANLTCEFQRVRNKISGINASPCQSVYISPFQNIFYLLRVLSGQAQITMSTSWSGSDVEMSLTSPSGRIIGRNTIANDVVHDVSGTHEVFTILNPQPGEWKVKLFGADVPASGEEVVFGFTSIPSPATPSFSDVPDWHPYFEYIEALYAAGLTAGCSVSPLKFCPASSMDRAQMAVFTLLGEFGVGYTPPTVLAHRFNDNWALGPWAEKWAEGMYNANLTAGCTTSAPLRFCPWQQTPREQAAVFALKLKYGKDYNPPPATGTVFADMTNPGYYATKWAEKAYADGLIPSCGMSGGKPLFCPSGLVDRGLGAYIIASAKNLVP